MRVRWCVWLLAALSALVAEARPMGTDDARHLLARAGFGAKLDELVEFAGLDREAAIERLLAGTRARASAPPPPEAMEYLGPRALRSMDESARRESLRRQIEIGAELRAWWLEQMLAGDQPLAERMTVFWHNHFVVSQQKVKSARLMHDYLILLRQHALGSFADLLHAVAKSPAMLAYLDAATNRKDQPNENLAREMMELFTLGEGGYDEHDVKEAARAFTGWSIDPADGEFKWRPFFHDRGEKTVLGRNGRFDGDDVLDILLDEPATARLVVSKLWREFVSPVPDPAEVDRIAARFRASGYDIRAALRALLRAPAFWDPANRGILVKSPVDLVVGTLRQLEVRAPDGLPFALLIRQLGQDLLAPPNVRGWPGGEAWIDSGTLLARKQFLDRLAALGERQAWSMRPVGAAGGVLPARSRSGEQRDGADASNRLRQRFGRALAGIRFDARTWLARVSAAGLDPARVLLAANPADDDARNEAAGTSLRRILLDPSFQLR